MLKSEINISFKAGLICTGPTVEKIKNGSYLNYVNRHYTLSIPCNLSFLDIFDV